MTHLDEVNLTQMITQFGPMVYRLAFSLTKNRSDADDVYQEVFIAYNRNKPNFESETHAKAWFLRVTSNACKKLWRNPFYSKTDTFDETFHHLTLEERGDYEALYLAISKLKFKYRQVIHLFYFEELKTFEIAELLGQNESTVRTQLTRARKMLKDSLQETEHE